MKSPKVGKHYDISRDLIDRVKIKATGKFNTEVKAIEYYLEQGLEYDEAKDLKNQIFSILNANAKDMKFIKKILIQLFVNKKFAMNREIKKDEAYNKFLEKNIKDKFID